MQTILSEEEKLLFTEGAKNISQDFDAFCSYIEDNQVKVSKSSHLMGKKDCHEINQLLSWKEDYQTSGHLQTKYAVIHFLYFFSIRYEILVIQPVPAKGLLLTCGRAYDKYKSLSTAARYLVFYLTFLYEYTQFIDNSAWDWKQCEAEGMLEVFSNTVVGEFLAPDSATKQILGSDLYEYSHVLRIMQTLSLCEVEYLSEDQEKEIIRNRKSIRKAAFGTKIASIKVLKMGNIIGKLFNHIFIDPEEECMLEPLELIMEYSALYAKELAPKEIFLIQDLISGMSDEEVEVEETYLLKVSLRYGDCSRTVRMNSQHTLEELHLEIQKAFGFGNDHLYNFSLGKGYFEQHIYCPHMDEEEWHTDEIDLGELKLLKGTKFTYLFDYGDEWWFDIQVKKVMEEIIEGIEIVESKNNPPNQYPDWEEEYDEDIFGILNSDSLIKVEYMEEGSDEATAFQEELEYISFIKNNYVWKYNMTINSMLIILFRELEYNKFKEPTIESNNKDADDFTQLQFDFLAEADEDDHALDMSEEYTSANESKYFTICKSIESWEDILLGHKKSDLQALCGILSINYRKSSDKYELAELIKEKLSQEPQVIKRLLNKECRVVLLSLYENSGNKVIIEAAKPEILASLVILGLFCVYKPRYKRNEMFALAYVEEGREIILNYLREADKAKEIKSAQPEKTVESFYHKIISSWID